jgi:hypothetical protein
MKKIKPLLLGLAISGLSVSSLHAQLFTTDVIIQGSECVGIDCVSGEAFGFNTILLKENNLRIKFDDTSASAEFPDNDWVLGANDSSNGGANVFFLEDATAARRIASFMAGAPANSLFVDAQGDLGLGTDNPVLELHIADGDTPSMRIEQDGSSGFTPQTWDVAGNETNFFIRDVTNGSTLPFRIRPGAPTSSIDIAASGNVGIGTSNPSEKLHVDNGNLLLEGDLMFFQDSLVWLAQPDTSNRFVITDAVSGNDVMVVNPTAPSNSLYMHASGKVSLGSNTQNQQLYVNGSIAANGNVFILSDKRMKKNITDLDYGLSDLMRLSPKRYLYRAGEFKQLNLSKGSQIGLVAQEVEAVMPEVITTEYNVEGNNGETMRLKGVNYTKLVPVLIHAVQEQQEQLDAKDQEILRLSSELEALKQQVSLINQHLVNANHGRPLGQPQNKVETANDKDSNYQPSSSTPTPIEKKSDSETILNNGRNEK